MITFEMAEEMTKEEAGHCEIKQEFESQETFQLVMDKALLHLVESGFMKMGVSEDAWLVFWREE